MTARSIAPALLIGLLSLSPLQAQTTGGVIRGEVRDPSHAAVAQAHIVVHSKATGTGAVVQSNEQGLFVTPELTAGIYTLKATKPGFKVEVFGPVTLEVNQTLRVDFALILGNITDSVEVESGGRQLVSSETAEIGQVITQQEVSQIPLNGRAWQQLIALSAGVNPGAPSETGSPNPVNVNGQRTKGNLFLVDGISTTSSAQGRGNNFNIPLDALQEFSVQAGAYSAEFGDVAGGVIDLQTKSGTNNWHGSLFEFFRNDMMDAANFFSNATAQPKNPLRYNQFGGSLGGPVRRDRTFFFADYQGTIVHNGSPMIATLPTDPERTGDFSGLRTAAGAPVPIYDPFVASLARTPFPGNRVPLTRIDPAAARITSLLPEPNQFGVNGQPLPANNFAVTRSANTDLHSFDVRVDHELSASENLFARYSFQNTGTVTPSLFELPLGGPPTGAGNTRARTQVGGLGHTYQFNPSWINELRLGVNRQTTGLTQQDYGQSLSAQFGIPGVNRSPQTSGLSNISVSGLFGVGGSILTPLQVNTTDWNFSEKVTGVEGRHTLKFGFDFQYEMGSTGYLVFGRGSYTFLSFSTSSAVGTPGGDAYASFLVGAPYLVSRDVFPPGLAGLISPRYGFYFQDDFKVNSHLTLNLGARYDIMPYAREKFDRLSNFDPATRTMLIAGQNTSQRLRNTDFKDLAPRIGLAYSPGKTSLTVLRAGYGIGFVDPVGGASVLNSNEFNIPFYFRDNITQFPFLAPQYRLSSLLPDLVIPSPAAPRGDQRYLTPNDRNQYSQTWSFNIQRALTRSLVVETAYVGTSGVRLLTDRNINAGSPGPTDPTTRRPFGSALGEIRELSNSAHSTYHGLQTKVEKRFARGLYFQGSYTFSKSIDNQSNGTDDSAASGQYPQNPNNTSLERGLSSFDRTHRLVGSAVWEVPSFRSQNANSFARAVLGGWQVSGIVQAATGTPFSVLMPCAAINAEGNNCRPNRIASGELPSEERTIYRWFDTAAFATPAPQAYGTAGRNILRAPGSSTLDLSLSKSIRIGGTEAETRRLQIRSEFFNSLNHPNFGVPVHSTDSPAIGAITSAGPGRVIQLGARLEF